MKIREYQECDREKLETFMIKLQEYIASIDPLKKNIITDSYKKVYVDHLLEVVENNKGKILFADVNKNLVGCIAGIISESDEVSKSYYIGKKDGIIIEMFVEEAFRGMYVAKSLMTEVENYFISQGCDAIQLEVFVPNERARRFYDKMGFIPRVTSMTKLIEKKEVITYERN